VAVTSQNSTQQVTVNIARKEEGDGKRYAAVEGEHSEGS
jgi:hypothetical protein